MNKIESLRIRGFRSLADVQINELPSATVLIGANGSGKSNVVRFFEMMSWMIDSRKLNEFVQRQGGADDQLFGGAKVTPTMEAEIRIRTTEGQNDYRFVLASAHPDRFLFTEEAFRFSRHGFSTEASWEYIPTSGHMEARIHEAGKTPDTVGINPTTARVIVRLLRRWATFQFHDTSDTSPMKTKCDAEDCKYLRANGRNLAAILYHLQTENEQKFDFICENIKRALPVFDKFTIEESYGRVSLRWKASGMEKTIGGHLTSDGSLRFFALVTLLNLPLKMIPDVLIIDEPELGLHPTAIDLLGNMIRSLSFYRQIILATQSPLLVDCFDLNNIRVMDIEDGRTTVRQPDSDEFREWLENYTTGEIWQKNLIGGKP